MLDCNKKMIIILIILTEIKTCIPSKNYAEDRSNKLNHWRRLLLKKTKKMDNTIKVQGRIRIRDVRLSRGNNSHMLSVVITRESIRIIKQEEMEMR